MFEVLGLAFSAVRISMPYAAGALGGTVTERSGTVNIAIEGFMLTAAFAYVVGSFFAETAWFPEASVTHAMVAPMCGLGLAMFSCAAMAGVHAFATIICRADHIISGFALNMLALGGTNFLLQHWFKSASNSPQCISFPPLLRGAIGEIVHPLSLLILGAFIGVAFMLRHTRLGLRLRSAGESPEAAASVGVNVARMRFLGILMGGLIAGLGGVWLASGQGMFVSNMTAGRGYIALAAMIVGRWRPLGALTACLFFGLCEALQGRLQIARQALPAEESARTFFENLAAHTPNQLIQALPYLVTLLVIAGFMGKSRPPSAVGRPLQVTN